MAARPVDDAIRCWSDALRQSDAAALAALVTEDSEFRAPGQPALMGRDAMRESFLNLFKNYRMEQLFTERERIAFDDHVLPRGTERNIVTPRRGVGETTIIQRVFTLVRREPDGAWRFARGISQFVAP